MNDPNGLVYHDGEYHLFYQHYPDSNVWGPMHWGHAVSTDLLDWQHLPVALAPDSLGYIFSGCAVMDYGNTSGFGSEDRPAMVAIFTHHDETARAGGVVGHQSQSIAYSTDRGRSWTKYGGNPVIPNPTPPRADFRDPKVIWNERTDSWLMVLAAKDRVVFYESADLKTWSKLSEWGSGQGAHGGIWECPDLFPLRENTSGETYWVLLSSLNAGGPNGGSATQYFIGEFSDGRFTLNESFARRLAEEGPQWIDYGRDNYAGVTWSDVPKEDGRRLFVGWMSNWTYAQQVPTETWRNAMTVPRALQLQRTEKGPILTSLPVRELTEHRRPGVELADRRIEGSLTVFEDERGQELAASEIVIEIDLGKSDAAQIRLVLKNEAGDELKLGYNRRANTYFTDRRSAGRQAFSDSFATGVHTAPRIGTGERLSLRVLLDRNSVELFADGGTTVMTDIYFIDSPWTTAIIETTGGAAALTKSTVFPLG